MKVAFPVFLFLFSFFLVVGVVVRICVTLQDMYKYSCDLFLRQSANIHTYTHQSSAIDILRIHIMIVSWFSGHQVEGYWLEEMTDQPGCRT